MQDVHLQLRTHPFCEHINQLKIQLKITLNQLKSAGCRNSLLVRWQFPDLLIQNGSRSHKRKVAEVWDSGCRDSLLVRWQFPDLSKGTAENDPPNHGERPRYETLEVAKFRLQMTVVLTCLGQPRSCDPVSSARRPAAPPTATPRTTDLRVTTPAATQVSNRGDALCAA